MSYELHDLCLLFPRMDEATFAQLKADIKANGLNQAIVLLDGAILDGGNRYAACLELGIEPQFKDFDGQSALSYVLSQNLHRRHLSAGQQAVIVASATDWSVAHPAHRSAKEVGNVTDLSTVANRAAESGASDKTQRMADKVARENPELAKQVRDGEISLPKAHAQVVAETTVKDYLTVETVVDAGASVSGVDGLVSDDMGSLEDAVGEFDAIAAYDAACAENDALREQIKSLTADDAGTEKLRQLQVNANLRDKLAGLEKKIYVLEMNSKRDSKLINEACAIVGAADCRDLLEACRLIMKSFEEEKAGV